LHSYLKPKDTSVATHNMHIKNSVLLASAALAPIALAQDAAAASNITRINFVVSNKQQL